VNNSSTGRPRITALICTLNEEENLPYVLPEIPEWVDEILLVDAHSTDRTVDVARELCPDIRILYQPGKGKGDALKHGIENASGDIIVTLDSDGETPPEEMERFVAPLLQGFDLVKGSRLTGKRPSRMLRYRWFGNKVLAITCNLLYGTHFTDICSGFNAYWRKTFLQLDLTPHPDERGCSLEQRMIVRVKMTGLRVKEVAHSSEGRIAGTSAIGGFRHALKQGFTDLLVIIKGRFCG